MNKKIVTALFITLVLGLQGCSTVEQKRRPHFPTTASEAEKRSEPDGPPLEDRDVDDIPDAVPEHKPYSKYGNPPTYSALGKRYYTVPHSKGYKTKGKASWYGRKFHGQRTSSGEPYDMFAMTGAHRSLPLPTYARVKNLDNNKEVIIKINDRGPFVHDRVLDLSYAAAKKLGIHQKGTGHVEVTAIDPHEWFAQKKKDEKNTQLAKVTKAKVKGAKNKPVTLAKAKTKKPNKQSTVAKATTKGTHKQGKQS